MLKTFVDMIEHIVNFFTYQDFIMILIVFGILYLAFHFYNNLRNTAAALMLVLSAFLGIYILLITPKNGHTRWNCVKTKEDAANVIRKYEGRNYFDKSIVEFCIEEKEQIYIDGEWKDLVK